MKFSYGGQAVIEGVMMMGRRQMAVSVRAPNGEIIVKSEPLTAKIYSSKLVKLPLVRGLFLLWATLSLGIKTMSFAANVALLDPNTKPGEEQQVESPKLSGWMMGGTLAASLIFFIGFFFVGPSLLAEFLGGFTGNSLVVNLIEGVIRLAIFLGYLWLIGRMAEIRRVFQYHGAEHKTINAYEAGAKLEPEIVQTFSTVHTRCGTSFLLLVVVLSIIVLAPLGRPPLPILLLTRILAVPLLATVAYEYIKWSANHYGNRLIRALMQPGLALQKLTTREPELEMLQVAITSLERVLVADGLLTQEEWQLRASRYPVRPINAESGVAA